MCINLQGVGSADFDSEGLRWGGKSVSNKLAAAALPGPWTTIELLKFFLKMKKIYRTVTF